MTRSAVILIIVAATAVIGAIFSFTLFFPSRERMNNVERPTPNPSHPLTYTGSVPYFAMEEAITSLRQNVGALDTVASFIYVLEEDGSAARREQVTDQQEDEVIQLAHGAGKKILVGIENDENPDLIETFLRDTSSRRQHIDAVGTLLRDQGYDGVVVDYENLQQDQAQAFVQYMRELSSAVHAAGKQVSISVNVETTGRIWHGIDVVAIAPFVDRLELNVYEEFNQYTDAGPVASTGWVNAVLRNVIAQGVPPEKVILGTAHAGHEWVITGDDEFIEDTSARTMLERRAQKDIPLMWDEESEGSFYHYQDEEGLTRAVWVEDQRSFAAKVDLAKAYGVQGMFLWYIGGEDPAVWSTIPR